MAYSSRRPSIFIQIQRILVYFLWCIGSKLPLSCPMYNKQPANALTFTIYRNQDVYSTRGPRLRNVRSIILSEVDPSTLTILKRYTSIIRQIYNIWILSLKKQALKWGRMAALKIDGGPPTRIVRFRSHREAPYQSRITRAPYYEVFYYWIGSAV